jgi:hypothetical protein
VFSFSSTSLAPSPPDCEARCIWKEQEPGPIDLRNGTFIETFYNFGNEPELSGPQLILKIVTERLFGYIILSWTQTADNNQIHGILKFFKSVNDMALSSLMEIISLISTPILSKIWLKAEFVSTICPIKISSPIVTMVFHFMIINLGFVLPKIQHSKYFEC